MKITTFEDIKAWQASKEVVKMVYDTVKYNKNSINDYKFKEQIQGVSPSTTTNIKELK
jgi:uncharacterized phage-associated protein